MRLAGGASTNAYEGKEAGLGADDCIGQRCA